jgi:Arc/MetJ-type ribon-helix-helix transcriptional regulator
MTVGYNSYNNPHDTEGTMKTIQMTLDEDLVRKVDQVVREMRTTRSEFTRSALRIAIEQIEARRLEEKHRRGYKRQPVKKGEFSLWEREQAWGSE